MDKRDIRPNPAKIHFSFSRKNVSNLRIDLIKN